MTDKQLKNFINDSSWDYSKETIESMMAAELEKEPEEINIEFVDTCMFYLGRGTSDNPEKNSEKSNTKIVNLSKSSHRRIRIGSVLLASVLIILATSLAVTSFAKSNKISISDEFVKFFHNYATIDYSDKSAEETESVSDYQNSELYEKLTEAGINNPVLPYELYYYDYDEFDSSTDFTETFVSFDLADSDGTEMFVTVEEFTDSKWVSNTDIVGDFTSSKKIEVNGIEVYLFERNGNDSDLVSTSISYQVDLSQYFINCQYDIDEAEQMMKSLK